MTMGYDPKAMDDSGSRDRSPLKAGRYPFRTASLEETRFQSGNNGAQGKLLVSFEGREVPCFVRFAYVPKALWKLREYMDCVGADFDNPPNPRELVGTKGVADFVLDEKGYFSVKRFLDPVEQTKHKLASSPRSSSKAPPVSVGDDAPF